MNTKFEQELTALINRYGMESGSNTHDFILARYLMNCLRAFNIAIGQRQVAYGRPASDATEIDDTPVSDDFRAVRTGMKL